MTLKRVGVTVIDSGVADTWGDNLGHGTACAALISAACEEVVISSIAIVDDSGRGSVQALVAAIERAVAEGAGVINISLGLTGAVHPETSPLARACRQAAEAGVVIVAAEHNDGLVSYPAHLPSVIGVRGAKIYGHQTYYYCPGQPIECVARGDAQRVRWLHGKEVLMGGNSFAAPRITGIVARFKQLHPDAGLEEIRVLLQQGATGIIGSPARVSRSSVRTQDARVAQIQRAALYPYAKEMHALVRFPDLLAFRITGIADPPGRGQVGRDAGQVIGAGTVGLQIHPSLRDAIDGADTLILGYLRQLGVLRDRDLHREFLTLAIEHRLHVFSFEPLREEPYGDLLAEARKRNLRFWWPEVSREQARGILSGPAEHGPVDQPVLGVFGTSASQGKFTLQLALRQRFLRMGYRVAQIGTEHHCSLFGMDFAFPMGYGSTVEVETERFPELLDRVMRRICAERRPDLFLVGSQSGTVPFDLNDHRTLTLPTLAFLMGTKPDACVLVVNDIDTADYIEATLAGLRSLGQTEVIALAVSDRRKEVRQRHGRSWTSQRPAGEAELTASLARLEERFGLPAVQITSQTGVSRLCDTVVCHFSSPGQKETSCQKRSA